MKKGFWGKARIASINILKIVLLMKQNMKAFIKYLIVAVCSAIVTYLTSSCTAGLVIGKNQRQQQENNISTRADSSHFVPTIASRWRRIAKPKELLGGPGMGSLGTGARGG